MPWATCRSLPRPGRHDHAELRTETPRDRPPAARRGLAMANARYGSSSLAVRRKALQGEPIRVLQRVARREALDIDTPEQYLLGYRSSARRRWRCARRVAAGPIRLPGVLDRRTRFLPQRKRIHLRALDSGNITAGGSGVPGRMPAHVPGDETVRLQRRDHQRLRLCAGSGRLPGRLSTPPMRRAPRRLHSSSYQGLRVEPGKALEPQARYAALTEWLIRGRRTIRASSLFDEP